MPIFRLQFGVIENETVNAAGKESGNSAIIVYIIGFGVLAVLYLFLLVY